MSETSNLGLTIEQTDDTKFGDFVDKLDANFSKIDEFAGKIYGTSGTVTLKLSSWSDTTYTLTVADLGDNDAIFFKPVTMNDKSIFDAANPHVTASGTTITFTVGTVPTASIDLEYFITRGA